MEDFNKYNFIKNAANKNPEKVALWFSNISRFYRRELFQINTILVLGLIAIITALSINSFTSNDRIGILTAGIVVFSSVLYLQIQRKAISWKKVTYGDIDTNARKVAASLYEKGVREGDRVLVLVPLSPETVYILIALGEHLGAVPVLVNRAIGLKNILGCIENAKAKVVIGSWLIKILMTFYQRAFQDCKLFISSSSIDFEHKVNESIQFKEDPDSPLLVTFTTGSTGPAKGVIFTRRMMHAQITSMIYYINPKEDAVAISNSLGWSVMCVFAGITAVISPGDIFRAAKIHPRDFIDPIFKFKVTTMLGSPILWSNIARYCKEHNIKLDTLQFCMSGGAPIPLKLHKEVSEILNEGVGLFAGYGATEITPIAPMNSNEVFSTDIKEKTLHGAGVCAGIPYSLVKVKTIKITDSSIPSIEQAEETPIGEVGEIIVNGEPVSPSYIDEKSNTVHKIKDNKLKFLWHRTGDVGYFDEKGRLWYCGRKKECVYIGNRVIAPLKVESVFNFHERIYQTAYVGANKNGKVIPTLILQLEANEKFDDKLENDIKRTISEEKLNDIIEKVLVHPGYFPVDPSHNSKIRRDALAVWASNQQ